MKPSFSGWITVCVPHYNCHRYIRRAVDSLLAQSYPWVRIIVINDGDSRPPWQELASIKDPRLLRYDLSKNNGYYFCLEVARLATPDAYFMMQDADDWAAPDRAAILLDSMLRDKSDLAVSAQPQFCEGRDGTPRQVGVRWNRLAKDGAKERFVIQQTVTSEFNYRVPHAGLIRTSALQDVGGYYGGVRVGWDTLLTNLVLMIGSISWTPEPLYYRFVRSDSLTHSVRTGVESDYATKVSQYIRAIYKECYDRYRSYMGGEITRVRLATDLQDICGRHVSSEDRAAIRFHADELRGAMR